MYTEVTNNHPVVRAFIGLLQENTHSQGTSPSPPPLTHTDDNTSSNGNIQNETVVQEHTPNGGMCLICLSLQLTTI